MNRIGEVDDEEIKLLAKDKKELWIKSCRFQLGMLSFMATFILYLVRTSMSVAIVCMTYDPDINITALEVRQKIYLERNCSLRHIPIKNHYDQCSDGKIARRSNRTMFEAIPENITTMLTSDLGTLEPYTNISGTDANGCPLVVDSQLLLRDLSDVSGEIRFNLIILWS